MWTAPNGEVAHFTSRPWDRSLFPTEVRLLPNESVRRGYPPGRIFQEVIPLNSCSLKVLSLILFPIAIGLTPQKSRGQNDGVASSQTITAPPGTFYCARCGRYHTATNNARPTDSGLDQPGIEPSPTRGVLRGGGGGVQNVFATLNAQRARQGIGALRYDPVLQAVTEQRARLMASMRKKGHPPGSFSPGTHEGVGWSSSYSPSGVSACFTSDPNMRTAGAAMATGSDGVYFAVVYR